MLGRSRNAEVVHARPRGDHEVIEGKYPAVAKNELLGIAVDRDDFATPETGLSLSREAPDGVGDVAGIEAPRRHLVQQRLERAVDVSVDEQHVCARSSEGSRRGQPGEPGADDDDSWCLARCGRATLLV